MQHSPSGVPRAKSILIVDDSDSDRLLLRTMVSRRRPETLFLDATTGMEALNLARTRPVDCVLLDLQLPDLDGLDVLSLLSERRFEAPVIMVTGTGDEEAASTAMREGASDYLSKHGLTPERLLRAIDGAIERRTPDQDPLERETLSVEEVAAVLGISRNTAYAAVQRGEIPAVRIGRKLLIPRRALDRLLSGRNGTENGEN